MQDLAFYAFPSLQQLQEATDDGLRAEGFGYRCAPPAIPKLCNIHAVPVLHALSGDRSGCS